MHFQNFSIVTMKWTKINNSYEYIFGLCKSQLAITSKVLRE